MSCKRYLTKTNPVCTYQDYRPYQDYSSQKAPRAEHPSLLSACCTLGSGLRRVFGCEIPAPGLFPGSAALRGCVVPVAVFPPPARKRRDRQPRQQSWQGSAVPAASSRGWSLCRAHFLVGWGWAAPELLPLGWWGEVSPWGTRVNSRDTAMAAGRATPGRYGSGSREGQGPSPAGRTERSPSVPSCGVVLPPDNCCQMWLPVAPAFPCSLYLGAQHKLPRLLMPV